MDSAIPQLSSRAKHSGPLAHVSQLRHILLRQSFHMFNAIWGVLAYHFFVPRGLAAAAIGTITLAWGIVEWVRLRNPALNAQVMAHPLFGRAIRPHEINRISGAFYFGLGVALSLTFFPKEAVEAACLVLGFGDATSAVVGRLFGRTPLRHRRTLEGTAAFAIAAAAAVMLFRMGMYGDAWPTAFAWGLTAAGLGTLAELYSGRIDDNLTIPLFGSGGLALLFLV